MDSKHAADGQQHSTTRMAMRVGFHALGCAPKIDGVKTS